MINVWWEIKNVIKMNFWILPNNKLQLTIYIMYE